jgi:hypothetical protein
MRRSGSRATRLADLRARAKVSREPIHIVATAPADRWTARFSEVEDE